MRYDVTVIGAGVTGALIARELSKYDMKLCLLEKENDVAMGSTKANSAIVHAGYDAIPGTKKAKLNVLGCGIMAETCEALDVPYKNCGSLVVGFNEDDLEHLKRLYDRGLENGVTEMRIIGRDELVALEPNIGETAKYALWAKTAGIVCPYELTIAAAECAVKNGCEFRRNTAVYDIDVCKDYFVLHTAAGDIESKFIINAAGVYADKVASMIGDDEMDIDPRSGDYFVLDKSMGKLVTRVIFQCPTEKGKGSLVTQTVDGNLLIGPTSESIDDKGDTGTTLEQLNFVNDMTRRVVPLANGRDAITSFAGLRAHPAGDDFIIGPSPKNSKFINVAGIESPGLTAAPAIARYVDALFARDCGFIYAIKPDYDDTRKAPLRFRHLSPEEKAAVIKENPAYGRVICRCETITEGEIVAAIHSPVGARDVDGVKRRVRAGMGRCQGGFCGSKVLEILSRELNTPVNEITKFGRGSKILYDKTKGDEQ